MLATTEFFYKNNKSPDGLFPNCKECEKQKAMKWAKENPEKMLAAYKKINRKPHRMEQRRDNNRQRRENGYFTEMYNNNPEQFRNYNKKHQAKKHKITIKQWNDCKKYFNHRCAYCGLPLEEHWIKIKGELRIGDFHREHVDDDGANDLSNCVPSCKTCNSSKWEFKFEEWYQKQDFYSEERLKKIYKWLKEDYKNYIQI